MIRLFLASLLPSLIALIALPALALSTGGARLVRLQQEEIILMSVQQDRQGRQAVRADAVVNIADSEFRPAATSIRVGQTVGWVNADERDHAVVGSKGEFRSGTIKPGGSFTFKFDKPGEYRFHCPLHPRAKGVVRVEE